MVKPKHSSGRYKELTDIRTVLGNESGRRFILRLLDFCGIYRSSWEASAKIHYLTGKQDVGRFILSEMNEADPHLYPKLLTQNIKAIIKSENKEESNERQGTVGQPTNTPGTDRTHD